MAIDLSLEDAATIGPIAIETIAKGGCIIDRMVLPDDDAQRLMTTGTRIGVEVEILPDSSKLSIGLSPEFKQTRLLGQRDADDRDRVLRCAVRRNPRAVAGITRRPSAIDDHIDAHGFFNTQRHQHVEAGASRLRPIVQIDHTLG